MYDSLKGKVALVTGAGKNIGESVALAFAREGCNLILHALHEESVQGAREKVLETCSGVNVAAFACDMRDRASFIEKYSCAVKKVGDPNIVVNNAGGSAALIRRLSKFVDSDFDVFDFVIDLNLKGAMLATKLALPHMIENKFGRIINIASIAGEVGIVDRVDYSAAKGGVIAMTKALAMEVGRYNITVNSVSPGAIERGGVGSSGMTFLGDNGHSGSPDEIANMVLFLASDRANFITGQDYAVDGGRTLGPIMKISTPVRPMTVGRIVKGAMRRLGV